MTDFRSAHHSAPTWRGAAAHCLDELGALGEGYRLGFLYVTDLWADAIGDIAAALARGTGVADWVGTVGIGVCAGGREYFDQPAMAVMVAKLPEDAYRVFPAVRRDLSAFRAGLGPWIAAQGCGFGVVHADPRDPHLAAAIEGLAEATGFLVGGLGSSRGVQGQLPGGLEQGGVSGVLFGAGVPVVTGLSQGCSPIGPARTISECVDNVLVSIDGRPALEVLQQDLEETAAGDSRPEIENVFAAFPVAGSDTGDYLVRNLVGIDPERGWLATDQRPAHGDRILFCRRDREAAERDLKRMLDDVTRRAGGAAKGALYISCLARGPNLFGPDSRELRLVREALGEVPLIGFFANGEISHHRLYAYTGVLTLFL